MNNIFKTFMIFFLFTTTTLFAIQDKHTYTKSYQKILMDDGYKAILSSEKKLIKGKNHLSIQILKNNTFVKHADVNIIFDLPSMPNIEFSKHVPENTKINTYSTNVDFKVKGEWKYELMFKTTYGTIYSKTGRVQVN